MNTAGFYPWCSSCQWLDHDNCLRDVARIGWWPWSRGIPCECPHSEKPMTADEVAEYLRMERPR